MGTGIHYQWDFSVLWQYRNVFFPALWTTAYLSAATILVGIVGGLALCWLNLRQNQLIRKMASGLIELIRALPPLVLLVWCYYCVPILLNFRISATITVIGSLGLYAAVFYAEIFRSGIQTVEAGSIEAALACGMSRWTIFRRILMPIAFRNVFPPFISQGILVVKNTSLAGYIAVSDILYMGQRVSNDSFRPLEVLSVVALTFVVLIFPLTVLARHYESRMSKKYLR